MFLPDHTSGGHPTDFVVSKELKRRRSWRKDLTVVNDILSRNYGPPWKTTSCHLILFYNLLPFEDVGSLEAKNSPTMRGVTNIMGNMNRVSCTNGKAATVIACSKIGVAIIKTDNLSVRNVMRLRKKRLHQKYRGPRQRNHFEASDNRLSRKCPAGPTICLRSFEGL